MRTSPLLAAALTASLSAVAFADEPPASTPASSTAPATAAPTEADAPRGDGTTEAPYSGEWGFGGPYRLDLGVDLGTSRRLDDPPYYQVTQRQGLIFGLGLDLFVSRRVSVGLGYEHLDLDSEDSGILPGGTVALNRDLNSLWATMRLYPLQTETVGGFLRVGLGAAWQSFELVGAAWSPTNAGQQVGFRCDGSDSLDFGFRGDLGVDVTIAGATRFLGSAGLDYYRLSDSVLSNCAPGAGTSIVLGLRAGLAYGLPL